MAKKTRTAELEALQQAAVKERENARDAELTAKAAQDDADAARSALVDAHASVRGIKAAEGARAKAIARADSAAIKAEGAALRVERAEKQRKSFEVQHARELIAEMEPAAQAAVREMEEAITKLGSASVKWSTIRQNSAELTTAVPNALPARDCPDAHGLEPIIRELGKAGDIPSPLPHFAGVEFHEGEQKVRATLERDHPEHRISTV